MKLFETYKAAFSEAIDFALDIQGRHAFSSASGVLSSSGNHLCCLNFMVGCHMTSCFLPNYSVSVTNIALWLHI